jgi:hypothetical protein
MSDAPKGHSAILLELATFARDQDGAAQLRLTLDEFTSEDGRRSQYISARVWFRKPDGTWLPTQKGCTIKAKEIQQFGKGLRLALDYLAENV